MKQYIFLLISILVGSISVLAQEPTIRPNEDAATYFSKASIMDSTVFLVCNKKFVAANRATQTKIVGYVMTNMAHASRAVIKSNDQCWFWYLYNDSLYCSDWMTNQNLINDYSYMQLDRHGDDKWFFTFGGNFNLSTSGDIAIGVNGRVGTYLWKRFLDAGLGLNIGYSNYGDSGNCDVSVDLTSRLYFSRFFSKSPLAPFVGVGIGGVFSPDAKFNIMGSAGFNWYISKGSIDFSVQYGNTSKLGISAGYTTTF